MKIPITRPVFDDADRAALVSPLDTGWVVQGPKVAAFERALADRCQARHARTCTSCTTGLHLALAALKVGPGDEVVLPSFTYVASANAVEYVGARPVLVDIDLATFNIDPNALAMAITPRTKAIMPVHLFGLAADLDAVQTLAGERDIPVVEDAACALGTTYGGRPIGAHSDLVCFSLHPRKLITTGEGGVITTNRDDLAAAIDVLRNHGATATDLDRHEKGGSRLPEFPVLGYNYRMNDFQGALGISQLAKLDGIIEARRRWARRYDQALAGLTWLATPLSPKHDVHTYQSYVCLVRPEVFGDDVERANRFRNELMDRLEARGVATRQGTHAVHTLAYYREKYKLHPHDLPRAYAADRLSMTLPLYPQMTEDEHGYVVEQLRTCAASLGS